MHFAQIKQILIFNLTNTIFLPVLRIHDIHRIQRCSVVELIETRAQQLKKDEWASLQDVVGIYASEEFYIPKVNLGLVKTSQ